MYKNLRDDKRAIVQSIATHGGLGKTTELKGFIEVLRRNDFTPLLISADPSTDGFKESYGARDENLILLINQPLETGVVEINLEDKDSSLSNILSLPEVINRDVVIDSKGGVLNHYVDQYGSLRPFYEQHADTSYFVYINLITELEKSFINLDTLVDAHECLQSKREKAKGEPGLDVEIMFVNIISLGKIGLEVSERKKITEKYSQWLKTTKLPKQISVDTFRFEARFDNAQTKDFFSHKSIIENLHTVPAGTKIVASQFLNEREEAWGELLGF